MANPLLMIGPGGDYASRYYVKGLSLAKRVGSTLGQQPDTETAGSFAGYGQSFGRQPHQEFSDPDQATIDGDAFEHGSAMPQATYTAPITRQRQTPTTSAATTPSIHAATAAAAAEAWLAAQHRTLVAIPLFSPAPPAPRQAAPATRRIPLVTATETARTASPAAYRTAIAAWPRIAASVALPILDSPNGNLQDEWTPQAAGNLATLTEQEHQHEPHPETASHSHPYSRPAPGAGLLADDAGTGRRTGRQQGHRLRAHRGAHQKGSALARSQQGTLFNG